MTQTNEKTSKGLLSGAFGVAKKLTQVTQNLTGKAAVTEAKSQHHADLAQLSQQMLGGRYAIAQKFAQRVAPQWSDKVSDYVFDQINHLSSNLSSVDAVLDEAGARDLEELTQDVNRSKRISQAFAEQNKWIASVQGALTGATGLVGATVDVPVSIIMSLRMIYQVGRAYGFELDEDAEQDIVQFIFKQINLGLIAEKQTLILGLKTLSSILKESDPQQLQQFMSQHQDLSNLKTWLMTETGELKLPWLQHVSKWSIFNKITPVASASVSALYSWRLLEDVNHQAQEIFSLARQYLQQHQDVQVSAIVAYQKALDLIAQSVPKLLDHLPENHPAAPASTELQFDQSIPMPEHDAIVEVKLLKKQDTDANTDTDVQAKTIDDLAAKMLQSHPEVAAQKPAVSEATAPLSQDTKAE